MTERRALLAQALPIMLGQALVPLVNIVDAALIGRSGGGAAPLAGVALGATLVNFLFWTFGFLRMGVTGLTAQAEGAGDAAERDRLLLRGLMLGAALGLMLIVAAPLLAWLGLWLLGAGPGVAAPAGHFVRARLLGAPAALALYAVSGWLLGLGRSRDALHVQLLLNGLNIVFDLALVRLFHAGVRGIGLGTSAAEWCALLLGLRLALRALGGAGRLRARIDRAALFAPAALRRLCAVQAEILVRTLALLALFGWFAHVGARRGAVALAANHVLLQMVSISAFMLDGIAFTAEARVGQAIGAGARATLRRAIRLCAECSALGGLGFALAIALAGSRFVALVTPDPAVRAAAAAALPGAALVPALGWPSWLLDGIFLGAARGRALRNAALVALGAYLVTDGLARPWGNGGAWVALLASYVYRALALGVALPGLMAAVGASPRDAAKDQVRR
ncbi:MATE family efflux transporter [Sphingomonas morindae]|uniref:MATE family efflux transporter n=1 Tax=Sphingomonas morindae TaxID=1541170 RepID=A0ABY4X6I1_9SPHN|nr:MATE family efflux transporter [Sphingomonas morindae]USI72450.1 MATE family efflux transporter [Sphingomonas morindae]